MAFTANELSENRNQADNLVTVLIADDHPLLRQALRSVLEKQADFRVVAEAADGEEAVRLVTQLRPNVVIMDIAMPVMNGLEATKAIKASCPQTAVLVLTVHNDSEHILGIIDAGAAGYLVKSVFGKEIINAVRAVVTGETIFSSQVFQQLLRHTIRYPTKPVILGTGEKLSSREVEILRMAAKGLGNKDIAIQLNLSLRTVKGYMVEVFSKLGVASRTEAVITGLRAGLLSLNDLE